MAVRLTRPTIALLAGVLLLLLVAWAGGDHDGGAWPMMGRLHPVLVHLPIGILLLAVLTSMMSQRASPPVLPRAAERLLLVGAWSAIVAAIAGLVLADWGSYDPATLQWHRRFGIAIPVLAVATYALRNAGAATSPAVPRLTMLTLTIALVIGGHQGGTLVRGAGYLTRFLPETLRVRAGLPADAALTRLSIANAETTPVFDSLIQPVLTRRCASCHNPDRKKGGLSLASAEGVRAGGREGKVVLAGRPDDSELLIRLVLPPGHLDAMPPDRPIPAAEIALIRWWIEQGASTTVTLAEIPRPASIRRTLAAYGLDDVPSGVLALKIGAPDTAAISAARRTGLTVQPLGGDSPLLSVDAASTSAEWTAHSLEALRPLAANIARVDLSRTITGDSALPVLGAMSHLTRLQLSGTRVTDAGLAALRELRYLESINLVDTPVTDAGVRVLETLTRLRTVYLMGTRVTDQGVERLRHALPRATVTRESPMLTDPVGAPRPAAAGAR